MSHCENFTTTLSDCEICKKSSIWKDGFCKSVGRFLGGPGKERHDQGGFSEALGSIYKKKINEKEKGREGGRY